MTGEAWNCPHCGERILRSAPTCPACLRHLRFDAVGDRPSGASHGLPAHGGRHDPASGQRGAVGVLGAHRGPRRARRDGRPSGRGRGRPPTRRGAKVHAARRGAGPGVLTADRGVLSRDRAREVPPAGVAAGPWHRACLPACAGQEVDDGPRPPSRTGSAAPCWCWSPLSSRRRPRRPPNPAASSPSHCARTSPRASPSTRRPPSRRCGRRCPASATWCSSIP